MTSFVYNEVGDSCRGMITSYRNLHTESLAAGETVRKWEPIRRQAEKRLRILDAAANLGDLAALKGDRKGQYSIRVNDQRRICFEWPSDAPGPRNVELVDYH